MTPIFLSALLGFVIMPLLLVLLSGWMTKLRASRGMESFPPDKVSLFVILSCLASWVIAGINIVIIVLRQYTF